MMKILRQLLLLGAVCAWNNANTQNLIQNPGFEDYSMLPDSWGQYGYCNFWNNAYGEQVSGYFADPDFFHLNGSGAAALPSVPPATVNPHGGSAIAGFLGYHDPSVGAENIREYLMVPLESALIVGDQYTVSFWITNGESSIGHYYKCDGIGLVLSTDSLDQTGTSYLDRTPQYEIPGELFTTSWQQYSYSFTADSAYTYLTIGNFRPDISTSVSVALQGPLPFAGAYYFVDDFSLTRTGAASIVESTGENKISVFPNPASDRVVIQVDGAANDKAKFMLHSPAGKLIQSGFFSQQVELSTDDLAKGIYVITVEQHGQCSQQKLIIQ